MPRLEPNRHRVSYSGPPDESRRKGLLSLQPGFHTAWTTGTAMVSCLDGKETILIDPACGLWKDSGLEMRVGGSLLVCNI